MSDAAKKPEPTQAVDLIAYEQGELTPPEVLRMFASLVKNGLAWELQGHYGRSAKALIEGGWISQEGDLLKDCDEHGREIPF